MNRDSPVCSTAKVRNGQWQAAGIKPQLLQQHDLQSRRWSHLSKARSPRQWNRITVDAKQLWEVSETTNDKYLLSRALGRQYVLTNVSGNNNNSKHCYYYHCDHCYTLPCPWTRLILKMREKNSGIHLRVLWEVPPLHTQHCSHLSGFRNHTPLQECQGWHSKSHAHTQHIIPDIIFFNSSSAIR